MKFLIHYIGGMKACLTDAHISDSSDISNAQPEKYNPEEPNTCDPNDADINSPPTGTESNKACNFNKEEEMIMEYQFSQTQKGPIDKLQTKQGQEPTTAKPSTNGTYSLIANSLHLLTV